MVGSAMRPRYPVNTQAMLARSARARCRWGHEPLALGSAAAFLGAPDSGNFVRRVTAASDEVFGLAVEGFSAPALAAARPAGAGQRLGAIVDPLLRGREPNRLVAEQFFGESDRDVVGIPRNETHICVASELADLIVVCGPVHQDATGSLESRSARHLHDRGAVQGAAVRVLPREVRETRGERATRWRLGSDTRARADAFRCRHLRVDGDRKSV